MKMDRGRTIYNKGTEDKTMAFVGFWDNFYRFNNRMYASIRKRMK
jgi:hypothetical protein